MREAQVGRASAANRACTHIHDKTELIVTPAQRMCSDSVDGSTHAETHPALCRSRQTITQIKRKQTKNLCQSSVTTNDRTGKMKVVRYCVQAQSGIQCHTDSQACSDTLLKRMYWASQPKPRGVLRFTQRLHSAIDSTGTSVRVAACTYDTRLHGQGQQESSTNTSRRRYSP